MYISYPLVFLLTQFIVFRCSIKTNLFFFFFFSSEGKELKTLILSDLYYQLQGEFEGRKIAPGAFKELHQYLVESKFLQTYHHHYDDDLFATSKDLYLFDIERLRAMWD